MPDNPILHIVNSIANLGNTQLGIEVNPDPVLGYKMWGGKDDAGNITRWLSVDKPGRLTTLQLTGSTTVGNGFKYVKHDASGNLTGGHGIDPSDIPDHDSLNGLNVGENQHISTIEKSNLHTHTNISGRVEIEIPFRGSTIAVYAKDITAYKDISDYLEDTDNTDSIRVADNNSIPQYLHEVTYSEIKSIIKEMIAVGKQKWNRKETLCEVEIPNILEADYPKEEDAIEAVKAIVW